MPVPGAVFVLLWCFGQGDGRSLLTYVSKAIVDFVVHFQVDQKCHETLHNFRSKCRKNKQIVVNC